MNVWMKQVPKLMDLGKKHRQKVLTDIFKLDATNPTPNSVLVFSGYLQKAGLEYLGSPLLISNFYLVSDGVTLNNFTIFAFKFCFCRAATWDEMQTNEGYKMRKEDQVIMDEKHFARLESLKIIILEYKDKTSLGCLHW